MTKLTTERLEKFVNDIKTDGMCDITDHQVESALIRLLAYEQAARNPVAWNHTKLSKGCGMTTPLYAAPVLPKQSELMSIGELLHRLEEQTGEKWVEESAQPVMAEQWRSFVTDADIAALHRFVECCDDPESGGHDLEKEQVQRLEKVGALQRSGRISYITDFGDYLISATAPINAQQNEPQNIPENIPAQLVSEPYKLPQGYALVPCKLTAENGAKSCMIGEFTEQTEISCHECFGDDECETCDGSGVIEVTVPVSWTTIKDIWAKGIEHFAAAPAQESE